MLRHQLQTEGLKLDPGLEQAQAMLFNGTLETHCPSLGTHTSRLLDPQRAILKRKIFEDEAASAQEFLAKMGVTPEQLNGQ